MSTGPRDPRSIGAMGFEGQIHIVFGAADNHGAMWAARQRVLDTLIVEFA